VLTILLRSQPDVRDRLSGLVNNAARPLLVAQEHELGMGGAFERRLPYRYLLEHHAKASMVVVADEGTGGLWRDPVGELAEASFSNRKEAAFAAAGYQLFLPNGEVHFLRRDLWDPWNDVRGLVAVLGLSIPVPPRLTPEPPKPRFRRTADALAQDDVDTEPGAERNQRQRMQDEATGTPRSRGRAETGPTSAGRPPEPTPVPAPRPDPFRVLGVTPTVDADGLKRAFRDLIVQYHPDKVAHMAAEFRELAERKSRELTVAYDAAQRILRGEPPLDG
jgi:DnaJ-domain-containing protein 1